MSRHSSHLGCLGLVVAGGVEDEFSDDVAFFGDDADVEVVDEHEDFLAGPGASDADVVKAAVVPQGEVAGAVDAVFTDAERFVDADALPGGDGSGACRPGGGWSASADRSVWPLVVVVVGEDVQLCL